MPAKEASDSDRWNRKYKTKEHGNSLNPDPLLVEYSQLFSTSQVVVDLACGTGRHAIYMAKLGCFVVAIDVSRIAIEKCVDFAKKSDVTVYPVIADLNMYRFAPSTLDAVVCFNYLNRGFAKNIHEALKPGGLLVMKTFNKNFLQVNPKFNRNYVLAPGDLAEMFGSLRMISLLDGGKKNITKSHLVARKPIS